MSKGKLVGISLCLLLILILPSNADNVRAQGNSQVTWLQVPSGNDDAEERHGSVNLRSNDLEMAEDSNQPQLVGMRFRNVPIPPNAVILSAHIFFTADSSQSGAANLVIQGDKSSNALSFNQKNISSRAKTSASASWNNVPAWQKNKFYWSADFGNVVQEIVSCNNWQNGNALAVIVSGNGKRAAQSYNRGSGTYAPALRVAWRYPTSNEDDCPGE